MCGDALQVYLVGRSLCSVLRVISPGLGNNSLGEHACGKKLTSPGTGMQPKGGSTPRALVHQGGFTTNNFQAVVFSPEMLF